MIDSVIARAMLNTLQTFDGRDTGATLVRLEDILDLLDEQEKRKAPVWQPFATAPQDGRRFDAWCVHPDTKGFGCRLCDVQMRGDRSGFGFIVHLPEKVKWQYLDARDPGSIFPAWEPTHWMERAGPPPLPIGATA